MGTNIIKSAGFKYQGIVKLIPKFHVSLLERKFPFPIEFALSDSHPSRQQKCNAARSRTMSEINSPPQAKFSSYSAIS
jgi:hypothetical protein